MMVTLPLRGVKGWCRWEMFSLYGEGKMFKGGKEDEPWHAGNRRVKREMIVRDHCKALGSRDVQCRGPSMSVLRIAWREGLDNDYCRALLVVVKRGTVRPISQRNMICKMAMG